MTWLLWVVFVATVPWLFFYILWKIKFKKPPRAEVPILTYHRVSDSFDLGITRQGVSQFERGIGFLYEQGYKSVHLKEVFSSRNQDEKKLSITFDDAYEDVYLKAFPILRRFGFTAYIFVITGYVDGYNDWDYNLGKGKRKHMSWEQIREMSNAGFGFGSHTVNHPDLTRIPKRFVEYELKRSKDILEDKLGQKVEFLSYPFGRYNAFVQQEAERVGYHGAFTLCPHSIEKGENPFARKRWGVYLLDSPLTLRIKLNQGRLFWIEEVKGWIINRFPAWTIILKGSPDYTGLNYGV